jgi:catechol 2,3-dioxygenase-like lactoylglutathione lyase family enzyme
MKTRLYASAASRYAGFLMLCLLMMHAARADTPLVTGVESIGIPVSDADRSAQFYTQVLGFRRIFDKQVAGDRYEHLFGVFGLHLRVIRLQLGDEMIDLMQFLSPQGRALPQDFHANDRWFEHLCIVVSDMGKAFQILRDSHVTFASPGPQRLPDWNVNAGGITAFYFKDPDGHHLEVLQFPPGKGNTKWHQSGKSVFLGIDHTAIVIAHTQDSLSYYRDFLGFAIAGQSDNYGSEQERLNNVFGARLHITTLRAAAGPGVELLEYITPRTGRAYPGDSTAGDRWQWVVNMHTVSNIQFGSIKHVEEQTWISNSPTDLESTDLGYRRGFMLRDPDGHADNLILQSSDK